MKNLVLAAVAVVGIGSSAVATAPTTKDIVDTAVAAGSFKTLAALVTEAGLIEALKSEGPFTVFAPTDEAFEALPKETLEAVAADKELLTNVLLYHVVAGKVLAKDVVKLTEADTLLEIDDQPVKVSITVEDGTVKINDSTVVATDVMATNGVIHVIDAVLIPTAGATATTKAAGGCTAGK